MLHKIPRVVISGLKGGSGKTTLTLGILKNLKDKGLNITPFKKGPDYIDAGWLARASGRRCYNLDTFIMPEDQILTSFISQSVNSNGSLIEGNRGLFDGVDSSGTFSTASLAKLCGAPIILVVDCEKTTNTLGVIVKGICGFDSELSIKGVVLNYTAGARHERIITEAIEKHAGVQVLGAIRRESASLVPERHMGLFSSLEYSAVDVALNAIGKVIANSVDIDKIWNICNESFPINYEITTANNTPQHKNVVKIGIIKDSSFQFYYPENISALSKLGADIIQISALESHELMDVDALYIGGGFPETNAPLLAKNQSFMKSLRTNIEKGLPVYAECGGFMFLGNTIINGNKVFPMTGIFPVDFVMESKPQAHGYTIVEVCKENTFFNKNVILKGHEFHYSRVTGLNVKSQGIAPQFTFVYKMDRGKGIADGYDGLMYKNVLATYTHLHALGSNVWAEGMISAAMKYKSNR
ncbi:MAG: hydrogenobyrinic acid a,c-diamide synthase (glutamine-hydrolyzing) [Candidatus Magnetoovum sp. WYHC-5]|nr:hydrogenobyrinic acid a,c-diamide synthase (glutamine-hydrolyzing) [Candidatus Magnetoovum sp. WYHC-5]